MNAAMMGPDDPLMSGSDLLVDGGVTIAYWQGDLAPE